MIEIKIEKIFLDNCGIKIKIIMMFLEIYKKKIVKLYKINDVIVVYIGCMCVCSVLLYKR